MYINPYISPLQNVLNLVVEANPGSPHLDETGVVADPPFMLNTNTDENTQVTITAATPALAGTLTVTYGRRNLGTDIQEVLSLTGDAYHFSIYENPEDLLVNLRNELKTYGDQIVYGNTPFVQTGEDTSFTIKAIDNSYLYLPGEHTIQAKTIERYLARTNFTGATGNSFTDTYGTLYSVFDTGTLNGEFSEGKYTQANSSYARLAVGNVAAMANSVTINGLTVDVLVSLSNIDELPYEQAIVSFIGNSERKLAVTVLEEAGTKYIRLNVKGLNAFSAPLPFNENGLVVVTVAADATRLGLWVGGTWLGGNTGNVFVQDASELQLLNAVTSVGDTRAADGSVSGFAARNYLPYEFGQNFDLYTNSPFFDGPP